MAERIIETAQESGVPVYEDNSLATVLTQLELGSQIPEQLYQAIVDIYVYFLNFADRKPGVQESQSRQLPQEGQEQNIPNSQEPNPDSAPTSPAEPDPESPAQGVLLQGMPDVRADGTGKQV